MFSNLSMKQKNLAAFFLIAFVCAIAGTITFLKTLDVDQAARETSETRAVVDLVRSLEVEAASQAFLVKNFILTGDRQYRESANETSARVEQEAANVREAFSASSRKSSLDTMDAAMASYRSWRDSHVSQVFNLMRTPETIDLARAIESSRQGDELLEGFDNSIQALVASLDQRASAADETLSTATSVAQLVVIVSTCIIGLLAVLLGIFNWRLLAQMTDTMAALARGDTDINLSVNARSQELRALAEATAAFQAQSDKIKLATEERIAADALAAEEKKAALEQLAVKFGDVAAAVSSGDLSRRIDADFDEPSLNQLANGMNGVSEVVEKAIDDLAEMLSAMANGDLSIRIRADYRGRFAELRDNANATAERLGEVVARIQDATLEVKNAVAEISSGTQDLSQRTEQAASSLEETAALTEQMSTTVRQNAENALSASGLADSATLTAEQGGVVVRQAVEAMSEIEGSAKKITDIIGIIDEIAFQTNLLALNASVEAARAGDAGKGFAVVAQEVRQLAQRSASASSDIKSLIKNSNSQVQGGVDLVNQAGTALGDIVDSIGKVASIVREISVASQEQATGVQEVNSAVAGMDQMTQQNAALVEESTAASGALDDQARKLAELISFFKRGSSTSKMQIDPAPVYAMRA